MKPEGHCTEMRINRQIMSKQMFKDWVVFGYMEASYKFWGRLRDGHSGQGEISLAATASTDHDDSREFQLDSIHHGFETHNQANSAAGVSEETEF